MKAGWQSVKLKDVCQVEKSQGNYSNLPYVGLENIESNTARFTGTFEPQTVKSTTFKFSNKHLLYGRLRPYLNKVLAPDFNGHCSTEIFPIKPGDKLNRGYLLYWFLSNEIVEKINSTSTGARMPRADMNEVMDFDFPLPSLPEQQRIVAVLDKAFAAIAVARANAESNLRAARELFENHLLEIMTHLATTSQNKKLDDVSDVQSGGTPSVPIKQYWEGDIPWYSSGELNSLFTIDPLRYITNQGLLNSNAKLFPKGSLLIGMYDTAALKMSILDRDATFNQAIAGVKPSKDIDTEFVLYAISAKKADLLLERRGVRQKNLSLQKIKQISIPVPSIIEQRQIVATLREFAKKTNQIEITYKHKIMKLDELKQSLLHHAFTGQL